MANEITNDSNGIGQSPSTQKGGITTGTPEPTYHQDSETIVRALTGLIPGANPLTGLGTDRDPNSYFTVANTIIISAEERNILFRCSRICQNIVTVYPQEASWFTPTFGTGKYKTFGRNAEFILNYFDGLSTGSLESKVREASIEARLHGEAYLLLGIDDGQAFDFPVDETRIKSLDWVQILLHNQAKALEKRPGYYEVVLGSFDVPDQGEKKLVIHESRLLKFVGEYLPPSILKKAKKHDSSLQAAYDGIAIFMQGIMASTSMLNDHSLFWYKLEGLATLVRQGKIDELTSRFLSLQMSKSVLKGLAMDAKNEDVGFISRNYTGVESILKTMMDYLVAETGMVRYKVLGTANAAGLGAEGRGLQDRLEHSLKMATWQRFCWRDNLLYCLRIGLLAQNSPTSGKLPKNLGIQFPPVYELTPEEIAKLYESNVTWVNNAIASGVIGKLEARLSLFGSSEAILNPQLQLDDRITEMMEEEVQAQVDSSTLGLESNPLETLEKPEEVEELEDEIIEDSEDFFYKLDKPAKKKTKRKVCKIGLSCGDGCISKTKTCKKVNTGIKASAGQVAGLKTSAGLASKTKEKTTSASAGQSAKPTELTSEEVKQIKASVKTAPNTGVLNSSKEEKTNLNTPKKEKGVKANRDREKDDYQKRANVSPEEAQATIDDVVNFTGGGYVKIRKAEFDAPPPDSQVENINKYIKNSPKHEGTIYRGLNFVGNPAKFDDFANNAGIGAEIKMGAMSSFTANKNIANSFSGTQQSVNIKVRSNKSGVDISKVSSFANEKEVIVPGSTNYRVVKSKLKTYGDGNRRLDIELEEI